MKPEKFSQDLHVTVIMRNGFTRGHFLRNHESIGTVLRDLRDNNRLEYMSQAALAKKLNTTQSVVSKAEDCSYEGTTLKTIRKFAEACGYSVALIFTQHDKEITDK